MSLPPIPKSQTKQIQLLELAVAELYDWILDLKGWDNPASIADKLSDETNLISCRAYDNHIDD
jgi:hypothetical protein